MSPITRRLGLCSPPPVLCPECSMVLRACADAAWSFRTSAMRNVSLSLAIRFSAAVSAVIPAL